ncbi:hypothetical protein MoryE10_26680 [Methylogaea oryzae]|uniref:Tetratricopeptide repeat protein n=1 Tax=Methylogaea oryzae TaxID=1295382 RepID=A0A8D4VRQ9_9GAMM|nr:hypothetical protein MoryE10_26680 [Methylogaea oryzae]
MLFAPGLPAAVDALLQRAVALRHSDPAEAERLLLNAAARFPDCLPAHFALYKYYANRRSLAQAEDAARRALREAARQGGFACRLGLREPAGERHPYEAGGAGHFYLFTLKALAFIKLRRNEAAAAEDILALLLALDPEDRSGASVVRQLADAVEEDG